MIVNKATLSEFVGKSQQTITTWQKNGLPMLVDGTAGAENKYETTQVIEWLIDREIKKMSESQESKGAEWLDSDQELARLRCAQANKMEIEVALLEGRVLDADDVNLAFGKLDAEVKTSFLSMPSRLAPTLIKIRSVKEMTLALKADVLQTLSKLSEPDEQTVGGSPSGET